MIAAVRMATNIPKRGSFKTLLRISNSGKDIAVTAIVKARTVPIGKPTSTSTTERGKIPAQLPYNGTPNNTARGTAKGLLTPAYFIRNSVGT